MAYAGDGRKHGLGTHVQSELARTANHGRRSYGVGRVAVRPESYFAAVLSIEHDLEELKVRRERIRPVALNVSHAELSDKYSIPQTADRIMRGILYGANRVRGASDSHRVNTLERGPIIAAPVWDAGKFACRFIVTFADQNDIPRQHQEIRERFLGEAEVPNLPAGITIMEASLTEAAFKEHAGNLHDIAAAADQRLRIGGGGVYVDETKLFRPGQ